jgi:hypothetical protein
MVLIFELFSIITGISPDEELDVVSITIGYGRSGAEDGINSQRC